MWSAAKIPVRVHSFVCYCTIWNLVQVRSFLKCPAKDFQPTWHFWGCMPERVDGGRVKTRDHVISFCPLAELVEYGIHSQPHDLMCLWTWYLCKFDIHWQLAKPISRDSAAGCSWGSAKPWWVAVISGCDVGDGDSGGTSSTLCTSAGLVESRFCVWSVSDFLMNFSCNCSNTVYFYIFNFVMLVLSGRSCRWTTSSAVASSAIWQTRRERCFDRTKSYYGRSLRPCNCGFVLLPSCVSRQLRLMLLWFGSCRFI